MVRYSLTLIAAAVIAGCGESKNTAPIAQDVAIQNLKEWQVADGSFVASDPDGQVVSISKISENGALVTSNGGGLPTQIHT